MPSSVAPRWIAFTVFTLAVVLFAVIFVPNPIETEEDEEGNKTIGTPFSETLVPTILYDVENPLSKAEIGIPHYSHYNWYTITLYVKYRDNAYVHYNRRDILRLTFQNTVVTGDIIRFYGRLDHLTSGHSIIYVVNPNNHANIYGSYTFTNRSWHYFNISLTIPSTTNVVDVIVDQGALLSTDFDCDYVQLLHPYTPPTPCWHNEFGDAVQNYTISIMYNITTQYVTYDIVTLKLLGNATYILNNTVWYSSSIFNAQINITDFNVFHSWSSGWIPLPYRFAIFKYLRYSN